MKKFISVILAIAMIMSLVTIVSFAEEEEERMHVLDIDYIRVNGADTDSMVSPALSPLNKDFTKLNAENISIYGWVAESDEYDSFGYKIDDGEAVFSSEFTVPCASETDSQIDAMYDWDNYRTRYDIIAPVTAQTKSVTFVMKYANGDVIDLFTINNVEEVVEDVTLYETAAYKGGTIIFDASYWLSNETDPTHSGESAAFAFRSEGKLYKIGFKQFWASNKASTNQVYATLKFDLYKFTGDFDESVGAEPVASVTAEAKGDNALTNAVTEGTNCTMERAKNGGALLVLNTPLEPGRYLFVASEITESEDDYEHYLVLPEQNADEYDTSKFIFFRDGIEDDMFSFDIYVYTDVEEPFGSIEAKATYHNASFDTIFVNGEMASFQTQDGSASNYLDAVDRKIDGSDGSVKTIGFRGWIGFEETIEAFGYQIGNAAPVFDDSFVEAFSSDGDQGAVQAEENGGANALRFTITVPVEGLTGENTIVAVVKVDGKIVAIDDALAASGLATKPNTELTYVGVTPATEVPVVTEAPEEPETTQAPADDGDNKADESESSSNTGLIIGIIAAVVVVAGVVIALIAKKKK